MVGLAFVVAMTVMFNSALASFTNALDDSVKADVIVDSGDQGITPEVARKLSSRTELGVVSPQRYGEFELVGEGTEFLSAVDPEHVLRDARRRRHRGLHRGPGRRRRGGVGATG